MLVGEVLIANRTGVGGGGGGKIRGGKEDNNYVLDSEKDIGAFWCIGLRVQHMK